MRTRKATPAQRKLRIVKREVKKILKNFWSFPLFASYKIIGGIFMKPMSQKQLEDYKVGEAISLAAVMAILAVAIVAVVVYRLFMSEKGTTTIPGGWKFTWN